MQRADGRIVSRLYRIPVSGRGVKAKRRANEKPRARVYRAAAAFVLALALAASGAVMRKLVHLAYGVLKTGKPFDPKWAQRA